MKWTEKNRQVAEVILKHRKDDAYDFKACYDELKDKDIAKSTISTVAKVLRENNWEIPPPEEGDGGSPQGHGISSIKAAKAPVVFEIRGEKVVIIPEDLYESYFIYLDMKARAGIDNTFSDTIKAGVETLWSLSMRPVITDGGEIKVG